MSTQYASPRNLAEGQNYILQCQSFMKGRSNPEVRFDPAAHLLEFEFGSHPHNHIVLIMDGMEAFDRIILEQQIIEDVQPEILDTP